MKSKLYCPPPPAVKSLLVTARGLAPHCWKIRHTGTLLSWLLMPEPLDLDHIPVIWPLHLYVVSLTLPLYVGLV